MPLHLPDSFRQYNIMGIDPGMASTGIAVFQIDCTAPHIRKIIASTLWNHKLGLWNEYDPELWPERAAKLLRIQHALNEWLHWFHPVVVGCEAPFYNPLMPMAFGSLNSLVSTLQSTIMQYNPNVGVYMVEPQLVKKSIGVAGKKGKDVVREAVASIPELALALDPGLDQLDEHAIDAVAVTHTLIKYKLPPLW